MRRSISKSAFLTITSKSAMQLHDHLSDRINNKQKRDDLLQFMATMLDGFPVACFMIDDRHRVIHWNRACEILTGVAAISIVGTKNHGKVFYGCDRMIMADLILDGAQVSQIEAHYQGKFRASATVPNTFEAEDFFPNFGDDGRWLYFTATRVFNAIGERIGAIETLQDVTARREAEAALRSSEMQFQVLSRTDDLTQLYNSRYFREVLYEEIARAKRYSHALSLIIFDIDHFKQINDTQGHLEGDRLLQQIAKALSEWKRETDFAFRFGGDEFAVILPETDSSATLIAAERLVNNWHSNNEMLGKPVAKRPTMSIGVAQFQPDDSLETLFRRADNAAYEAKRQGRDRIVVG